METPQSKDYSTSNPASPPRAGLRQRIFANMVASSAIRTNQLLDHRKRGLLTGLHGAILEIGPGTGANLPYFASDVRWLGVEPNPAMFPYLRGEASRLGMQVDLHAGAAERLPAPDASQDAVVSTLVLCSVRDPAAALREIRRVLKPGGRFIFMEHVAAPRGTSLRRWQAAIRPLWVFFGDGCHPDRETWSFIERAGFRDLHLERFSLDVAIVSPQIAGFAIK